MNSLARVYTNQSKVFISYARKDDFSKKLIPMITKALAHKGLATLVDEKNIVAGDAWQAIINCWLIDCHAAIVLFSKDALDLPGLKRK